MPFGDFTAENNFGELSGCEANTEGPKSIARPAEFCDAVTMASTLDVTDKTTLNETEVIPPAITVGGITFVPTEVVVALVTGTDAEGNLMTQSTPMTILVAQG